MLRKIKMRINRYLAKCGVASRRKAEEYIRQGRVQVNGQVMTDLAYQIQEGDRVQVDGKDVILDQAVLFLYHKPYGVLVSHQDPFHQRLIYQDLPAIDSLFAVGRLDYNSEGLLLVTNRGKLAQSIAHPSYEMEKEYWALLDRPLEAVDETWWTQGVSYRGTLYRPDGVSFLGKKEIEDRAYAIENWPPQEAQAGQLVKIVLHEGKKREVRRFFEALGFEVRRLIRVRLGQIDLGRLEAGHYRPASPHETSYLEERAERLEKGEGKYGSL